MHRAIGELLPTALAVMLNPFPVIAMVLLMASARGRRRGAAFTCGWMLGLSAQMALVLTFTNSTDAADGTSSALVDWLRVVVGALMIVWAAKKWGSRPRPGEEVVLPNWMAKIESVGVLGAFLVGLGLAGPSSAQLRSPALRAVDPAGAHGRVRWPGGRRRALLSRTLRLFRCPGDDTAGHHDRPLPQRPPVDGAVPPRLLSSPVWWCRVRQVAMSRTAVVQVWVPIESAGW